MTFGGHPGNGQLGERVTLDPSIEAELVRASAPVVVRRGLLQRPKVLEDAPSEVIVPIMIFEFSVTGIGFAIPEDEALHAHERWMVRFQDAETNVLVTGTYEVDGLEAWDATYLDSRPALLQTIEESVLHLDIASEEAHWNAGRD